MKYTYTTIRNAIIAYADDAGDPEFVSNLDDFIGKGHSRCARDLDLENSEQWIDLEIAAGDRNVSKGAGVAHVNAVFVRDPTDLEWAEVVRRSFEWLILYAPVESVQARPVYYASKDDEQIYLAPTPDQTYGSGNAKARVTARSEVLSSNKTETFISVHYGDLLFHACMIEAKEFQKNEQGARWYASKYESLIPSTAREIEDVRRKRYKNLNTGAQAADD